MFGSITSFLNPIKTYLYGIGVVFITGFVVYFKWLQHDNKAKEEEIETLIKEKEQTKVNNTIEVETEVFNTKQEAVNERINKIIADINEKEINKSKEVKHEENNNSITFTI